MRHLTTRLVILLMLALMIITGVYDYFRLVREREQLVERTRDDERIFTETLALAVSRNVRYGRTTAELQDLLDDILARPGLVAVTIFDPEGRAIAEHVAPEAAAPSLDDTVRRALTKEEAAAIMLVTASGRVLRYVQPFPWARGRRGAIEVRQSLGDMEREFRVAVWEKIVSRLVILGLFILSVVALTRWSIARPIRTLIAGAQAVGRGDMGQRIEVARRDEIGQLAEEFNRMATNLQVAHQEILRQAEERLRLEQEVQQAQRLAAVGLLAAEIAHEIGTPLNIISGRAEVLGRVLPSDHPERRHLEVILKQGERISGIIRDLLDYARLRPPTLREEAVVSILGRVADFLLGRCRAKGVRIHLDLAIQLPPILGDAHQLQQLFLNLLMNALDASPQGGVIRVTQGPEPVLPVEGRAGILRGKAEAPCLAIHIVDVGGGIPPEQLDQVFQPFFSTKKRGQGTGLGLPIVEEIVRAHRGEVEILSIPESGTEVIVRLPLPPDGAAGPAATLKESAPGADGHGR